MNRNLSLRQKLLMLFAVPLVGALTFAAIGGYRQTRETWDTRRMDEAAVLCRALERVSALAATEAQAGWALLAERGATTTYSAAGQAFDHAWADLQRRLALGEFGSTTGDDPDAWHRVVAASDQLQRSRASIAAAGTRDAAALTEQLRQAYVTFQQQVGQLCLAVGSRTNHAMLRSRFQELVWAIQLNEAAECAHWLLDSNLGTTHVTARVIAGIDLQQWRRHFAERQLRLTRVAERVSYWDALLGQKAYTRADALTEQWRNNAAPGRGATFPDADYAEWRQIVPARRSALEDAQRSAAEELDHAATNLYAATLRSLLGTLGIAAVMALGSLATAWYLIRSINGMLTRTVSELSAGNGRIDAVMQEMKTSTKRLADAAAQEAAALQETAASLQQLASMNQQNTQTAKGSAEQMAQIADLVNKSGEAMRALVGKMGEISHASEETQKIIQTIRDIAFQTNILALNASIEAARAGSAGTGFKVVAEEIRELAKRAAEASTETDRIIAQSHTAIIASADLCTRVDRTFDEAKTNAINCQDLTEQIRVASEEVSRGVDHIRQATDAMNTVMNQNVAISEENAGTTDTLFTQAGELASTVAHLEHLVFGANEKAAAMS